MSGKVMTLGVASVEVRLIASDENFAADLANADRPRPARAHSRQRWPSEPLASLHWPSRENLRSVASSFEIILCPETRLHVRLVTLSRGQRYGDIFDCRPRAAYAEYPRCKAQPHRPPWRWIFAGLTRAAEKSYVRH